jgi:hypothetical protein
VRRLNKQLPGSLQFAHPPKQVHDKPPLLLGAH